MLKVKKLREDAITPTVTNPGEDLGFDLYAVEDKELYFGQLAKVSTGIAAYFESNYPYRKYGLLYRDRSSMAAKGIIVSGGVIDAGYRGELIVMLTNLQKFNPTYHIKKGDKIVQMIPIPIRTDRGIQVVEELPPSKRGTNGFGSSGK